MTALDKRCRMRHRRKDLIFVRLYMSDILPLNMYAVLVRIAVQHWCSTENSRYVLDLVRCTVPSYLWSVFEKQTFQPLQIHMSYEYVFMTSCDIETKNACRRRMWMR